MGKVTEGERIRRDKMLQQGMLWCSSCKQFQPIKEYQKYTRSSSSNYGYSIYCLRCERAKRGTKKEKTSQWFKERNAALKAKFAEFAGGRCQRCGYDTYRSALDFHHVYRAEKKYTPSHIIYSGNFDKAWKELDKCCLLCQNCHHAYEAGQWRAEFIKRDGLLGWTIGAELPLDDSRYEMKEPPRYEQAPMPLFTYEQKINQLILFESHLGYG